MVASTLGQLARPAELRRSPLFILNVTIFQPMTKTPWFLVGLVLLCINCATLAQTPAARIATGERSWPTFWRQFTMAINKKDHAQDQSELEQQGCANKGNARQRLLLRIP